MLFLPDFAHLLSPLPLSVSRHVLKSCFWFQRHACILQKVEYIRILPLGGYPAPSRDAVSILDMGPQSLGFFCNHALRIRTYIKPYESLLCNSSAKTLWEFAEISQHFPQNATYLGCTQDFFAAKSCTSFTDTCGLYKDSAGAALACIVYMSLTCAFTALPIFARSIASYQDGDSV